MMLERMFQAVHGHLGLLAGAALVHPALILRRGKPLSRRNRWAIALAALFTCVAFGSGLFIYGSYRSQVKRQLFQASARSGLIFETKEHLGFMVLCLCMGAAVAALVAPRDAQELRRACAGVFGLAAILCFLVSALGTYVTAVQGFF